MLLSFNFPEKMLNSNLSSKQRYSSLPSTYIENNFDKLKKNAERCEASTNRCFISVFVIVFVVFLHAAVNVILGAGSYAIAIATPPTSETSL